MQISNFIKDHPFTAANSTFALFSERYSLKTVSMECYSNSPNTYSDPNTIPISLHSSFFSSFTQIRETF